LINLKALYPFHRGITESSLGFLLFGSAAAIGGVITANLLA
jgi:hypothetical protein